MVDIEHEVVWDVVMESLVVELPVTTDDWANSPGRDVDAKLRALDVATRRIEAAIVGASRGGPTDPRNGKIMCDHHNIYKHANDYCIERHPDGTILIARPDGTHLQPPDAA